MPVGSGGQSADKEETRKELHVPSTEDVVTHGNNELTQWDLVTCLSKILKSAREIKVCVCVSEN